MGKQTQFRRKLRNLLKSKAFNDFVNAFYDLYSRAPRYSELRDLLNFEYCDSYGYQNYKQFLIDNNLPTLTFGSGFVYKAWNDEYVFIGSLAEVANEIGCHHSTVKAHANSIVPHYSRDGIAWRINTMEINFDEVFECSNTSLIELQAIMEVVKYE